MTSLASLPIPGHDDHRPSALSKEGEVTNSSSDKKASHDVLQSPPTRCALDRPAKPVSFEMNMHPCKAGGTSRGFGLAIATTLATSLLLSAGIAQADDRTKVQEQRNGDGSWLRLTQTEHQASGTRTIRVDLRGSSAEPYGTVLERTQPLSEFPNGWGYLEDKDGDGLQEITEIQYCGAGPNCTKNIFKVNPERRKAWLFLHGGFFVIRRIGEFVVTEGRSGCCSWEHQVFRIPPTERTITEQDQAYTISVNGPLEKDSTTARCFITRSVGSRWVITDLINQPLRQLCRRYGDDVEINPPSAVSTP